MRLRGVIVNIRIGDPVELWVRTSEKTKIRISFYFKPKVYLSRREFEKAKEFLKSIEVIEVWETVKTVNPNGERKQLVGLRLDGFKAYKKFSRLVDKLDLNAYNVEIYPEQLFLRVPVFNLIDGTINNHGVFGEVLNKEDPDPPLISVAEISINRNEFLVITQNDLAFFDKNELLDISNFLRRVEPDILLFDEAIPKAIIRRLKESNPETLFVGKDQFPGLSAVSEKALFSYVSPKRALGLTIGNSVDARQCFFALEKGWALPRKENNTVFLRPASLYYRIDKGGLIIAPYSSYYKNVVALDFTSMFPNLIIKYNLSYETCKPEGVEKIAGKAFLPSIVEEPLRRRLMFKKLKDKNLWAKQRYDMLKLLLVAIYGYSGKLDNRFGNALCNMYLNHYARLELEKAIALATENKFEVVYADTDSIFVTKRDMSERDVGELRRIILKDSGMPVKIENYFKVVVFGRTRDNKRFALKRYYGLTIDGRVVIKGFSAVRRDTAPLIKNAQLEAIKKVLNMLDSGGYESLAEVVQGIYGRYADLILGESIEIEELALKKKIRKDIGEYKSNQPHVIAAKLSRTSMGGEFVEYVFTNARSKNPFNRVAPLEIAKRYDKSKYLEMLRIALNEVVGPLGIYL